MYIVQNRRLRTREKHPQREDIVAREAKVESSLVPQKQHAVFWPSSIRNERSRKKKTNDVNKKDTKDDEEGQEDEERKKKKKKKKVLRLLVA